MGNRIFATDVQESIHILRYKIMENQLVVFADDTCPRFTVACCILDYSTVCLTDKFGNISIVSTKLLPKKFNRKHVVLVTSAS